MNLPAPRAPVTASQVPDEWCALVHEVAQRDGHAMRGSDVLVSKPGEPRRFLWTIAVQCINEPRRWLPLNLPNGAHLFVSAEDRDIVLNKIQRRPKLPAG